MEEELLIGSRQSSCPPESLGVREVPVRKRVARRDLSPAFPSKVREHDADRIGAQGLRRTDPVAPRRREQAHGLLRGGDAARAQPSTGRALQRMAPREDAQQQFLVQRRCLDRGLGQVSLAGT